MKHYKTIKTAMGRTYRVEMTREEVLERRRYWAIVTIAPFLGSIILMAIWLAR
jgi:hypothetical protein